MDTILQEINKYIGSSTYVFVPIIVLCSILLIAGLFGLLNGWKTSLYFFSWNLTGVILGIFVTPIIIDKLGDISFISSYLDIITNTSASLLAIILIFLMLLFINFFAFLFYWIFRKKLKFAMKENKLVGHSNIWHRLGGMGIAVVSAAPISIFLADTSAVMSKENGFTKILDKLTGWLTGGKYQGTGEARVLVKNIDHVKDFIRAITGADWEANPDTKAGLEKILNTDFVKNVDAIYSAVGDSGLVENLDGETIKDVTLEDIEKMPAIGVKIPEARFTQLQDSLTTLFKKNNNPNAEEIVKSIISRLKEEPVKTSI